MGLVRKHIIVTGKVQGVGYRWNARSRARTLGLTGWVRNLPDSRKVELYFQGEQEAVSEMENWCRTGGSYFRVTGVSIFDFLPVEDEAGFEIR